MPLHKIFFYLFLLVLPFQLGRHFWPDWSYVWGLRVDYLSPTVYLSDILLGLTLIAWLAKLTLPVILNEVKNLIRSFGFRPQDDKKHPQDDKKHPQDDKKLILNCLITNYLITLGFLGLLVLNFRAATFPLLWLYKLVKLVELVLLGIYVVKNNSNPKGWRTIISLLLIGAVFQSGLAIAQFIKQSSVGGIFWWLGERTFNITTPGIATIALKNPFTGSQTLFLRPYGTFSHPNSLAGYLLVILVISSSRLFQFFYSLKFVLYSFLLVSFLLTFSRSAWIAGLILLGIICLGHLKSLGKEKKILSLSLFLLLSIIYYLLSIIYTSGDPEGFQKRWQLTLATWEMIKSSPLFGIGLGRFIPKLAELPQKGQIFWLQPVHNIFLLVAAETGLIGLFFFSFLIIKPLRNLLKIGNKRSLIFAFAQIKRSLISIENWKLEIPLLAILLTGAADHYWLTLQQNQLLFALVLGLCWSKFLTLKNLYSNRTVVGAGNFGKNKSLFKSWN